MACLILFLVSFIFYVSGVAPTVYGGDTGEFVASVHTLGLPHAPGYPTYVLFGRAFANLIPFGNLSYKLGVFSAVLSASVLGILFYLLKSIFQEKKGTLAALAGVLVMGTAPIMVDQAHVAEAFQLNLLFVLSLGWALWNKKIVLASFLFGLGLGNHHILIVMAPLLLWVFWNDSNKKNILLLIPLFFCLGFSVYLYLPIRALHNPPVNFGDPETFSRFWAVLTRKEFGSLSLHPAAVPFHSMPLLLEQAAQFLKRAFHQVGGTGLVLAGLGIIFGLREKSWRWMVVLAIFGFFMVGFGFEAYSNLSPGSRIAQWRLERFFLIPLLSLVVLMGLALLIAFQQSRWTRFFAVGLLVLLGVEKAVAGSFGISLRHNYMFRDFSISALRTAPPSAWVLIDRILFDEPTSAILVRTQVEGIRQDLRFLYRPGTLFNDIYGEDYLELTWPDRFERQSQVEYKHLSASKHSVVGLAFERDSLGMKKPVLEGFLYKEGDSSSNFISTVDYATMLMVFRHLHPLSVDYPTRLMAVYFPYFLGKSELEQGHKALGGNWFDVTLLWGWDMAWLRSNLGSLMIRGNDLERAGKELDQALRLDPYFGAAHFGRGYVSLQKEDFSTAVRHYEEALRLDPSASDAVYMMGVAALWGGDNTKAQSAWRRYLKMAPEGPYAPVVVEQLKKLGAE